MKEHTSRSDNGSASIRHGYVLMPSNEFCFLTFVIRTKYKRHDIAGQLVKIPFIIKCNSQPRLCQIFLFSSNISKASSDLKGHSISNDERFSLSQEMRRSWAIKPWMIRYAVRNRWAFDFLFWRYLDPRYEVLWREWERWSPCKTPSS